MKIRAFFRIPALLTLVGLLLLLFSAKPVQAATGSAYVRVIHASPFVGTADVFVDGHLLLTSFQFGAVTDYVPVPAGTHRVQIALVGKGIDASVLNQDLTVNPGGVYTIAALGTQLGKLSLQVFKDDNDVVPGQARIRVYHLAPDAGQVNVNVGGDFTLQDVSYQQASNYYTVDTGPCQFTVDDLQYSKNLSLTATLRSNMITSIFAIGLFQGNPKVQLVAAQSPGIPGAPNTGSDPTPQNAVALPWLAWSVVLGLLLLSATSLTTLRSARHR